MNFDKIISREGTYCEKYESRMVKFGTDDVLPLWVADMDLSCSDAIQKALVERVKHPIYGYTGYYDEYFDSISRWMDKAYGYKIQKEWIAPINAIVTGLNLAVEALTKKGDGIIIQPPIYPPFYYAAKNHGRRLIENELILVNNRYEIDFEDFEKKAKDAKLFLFCSPHNPTGRVFKYEELEKLAKICKENEVIIISDEVHADLVYEGNRHIPIATLKDAKDITVTLNAPSKTFNIAGIASAYAIVENSSLRRRFYEIFRRYSLTQPTPISLVATVASYTQSDTWLIKLLEYLKANLEYIESRLVSMPKIKPLPVEATFLLWLDCRELGLSDKELEEFFVKNAKLGLNSGVSFGKGGAGFMRFNFATSRIILTEAMDRLERAYITIQNQDVI
jgi:cystathionine beta-lyase